jgi:hypothetical protein
MTNQNQQQVAAQAAQTAVDGIITGLARRIVQLEAELAVARMMVPPTSQTQPEQPTD